MRPGAGAYRKIRPSPTPKFGGRPPILSFRFAGMPRAYKSRKSGEKISARFQDMNFRNLGEKSTFLELGEFPTCQKSCVDAPWSPLGVCQIWSESVELFGPLGTFFCLSPCRPIDRVDEYTIYIVVKGRLTESV